MKKKLVPPTVIDTLKQDDNDGEKVIGIRYLLHKTSDNFKLVSAYLLNLNLDIRDRIQLNMVVY